MLSGTCVSKTQSERIASEHKEIVIVRGPRDGKTVSFYVFEQHQREVGLKQAFRRHSFLQYTLLNKIKSKVERGHP